MADANQIHIFDRALLRRRRDRAAEGLAAHGAIYDETATLLVERLADVTRPFPRILDLGARNGALAARLQAEGRGRELTVAADLSQKMLGRFDGAAVVCDEEILPFAAESFDLVVSNLSLHLVNDLPGALAQIRALLRPGGMFIAAVTGGETLRELRACMMEAELAVTGGVSPRVAPVIDLPTATALLQRAGFSLPVTDRETMTLVYADMYALLRDLRGMGETNIQRQRIRAPTRRQVMAEAARLYQARHANADGAIPAIVEIIFLHGWREDRARAMDKS